jgi:hypothetical protein
MGAVIELEHQEPVDSAPSPSPGATPTVPPVGPTQTPNETPDSKNLIRNSSFESGRTGWSAGVGSVSHSEHRTGEKALLLPGICSATSVETSQVIPATSGQRYSVEAWFMTNDLDGEGKAVLEVEYLYDPPPGGFVWLGEATEGQSSGNKVWDRLDLGAELPGGVVALKVTLGISDPCPTNRIWFDDVSMTLQ